MKRLFATMFLVFALLAMTTGAAFAQEPTPVTGTVQTVAIKVNESTGETVVVVTLLDETTNMSHTVQISLETAQSLGLVTTDSVTGETTVANNAVDSQIEIDPTSVIPEEDTEENQHPVGSALSDFFSSLLGVDYETIMDYHDEGVGFGVIAQALWLSNGLDGGTSTFTALLDAKQSGDYSAITLADGSTPDNWGDVVKSLKKAEKLGSVMSGQAAREISTKAQKTDKGDKKNNNRNGNSSANGNGNNNGNGGGNGNNGGGNGNGH